MLSDEINEKRSLRQPEGGARHPTDLRARRSFEHHIVNQRAPRSGVMYCVGTMLDVPVHYFP